MDNNHLKNYVKTLSRHPGVYRMLDKDSTVIYVGKAKNLKNRVSSYLTRSHDSAKTRALVNNISSIEVTITDTEADALLLESNLIKEHKPRYNVVFRDDKSYPYLYMSIEQDYPRLSFYRGSRKGKGRYYGPYPSAGACRRTLNLVQKLFKLRQCDDNFFKNRQRPCLQYQIKRCSAPCVDYISKEEYGRDNDLAMLFLEGKNEKVIKSLEKPMLQASENLEYEKAAQYRNQITMLRQFQESQHIIAKDGDADFIACKILHNQACLQVFIIRGGHNLGNKVYFQTIRLQETPNELIESFMKQYYLGGRLSQDIPVKIYVSDLPDDARLLSDILSKKFAKNIYIHNRPRGDKARLMKLARENAEIALRQRRQQNLKYEERMQQLAELLKREEGISRIECFDISHLGGNDTVGSCVVYGHEGAIKSDFRRFNIEGITAADDYQAMAQVIDRHYTRIRKNEGKLPDLILLDGGKGQVSTVKSLLREMQLDEAISLLGIAKGPARKAGMESLVLSDGKSVIRLRPDSAVLHLLQEIRDDAHRFAITGQRKRRTKNLNKSLLDEIQGVGSKRRHKLILHFGGIQGVKHAGPDELARVPGISRQLAQKIYDTLHN
jgi:excinuclease ABC subunit C